MEKVTKWIVLQARLLESCWDFGTFLSQNKAVYFLRKGQLTDIVDNQSETFASPDYILLQMGHWVTMLKGLLYH